VAEPAGLAGAARAAGATGAADVAGFTGIAELTGLVAAFTPFTPFADVAGCAAEAAGFPGVRFPAGDFPRELTGGAPYDPRAYGERRRARAWTPGRRIAEMMI
jgi:hypothetical protein